MIKNIKLTPTGDLSLMEEVEKHKTTPWYPIFVLTQKINEIINHLNTLELNRIEALNKLSGSKAFESVDDHIKEEMKNPEFRKAYEKEKDNLNDNSNDKERKELSRFIKKAKKTLGINDNRKEK